MYSKIGVAYNNFLKQGSYTPWKVLELKR